ncbi:hypothetical protein LguiB_013571 [Lonicera macranthoides]
MGWYLRTKEYGRPSYATNTDIIANLYRWVDSKVAHKVAPSVDSKMPHKPVASVGKIAVVYFLPEEADVRALWTHIGLIGTFLDDMFDDDGSREELLNIVELVEKYVSWVDYIKSQMKEVEWWRKKETPSMDEYITNGRGTIGVGLMVIGFYFLGVEFSKETMSTPESQSLYKHGGLLLRLLNDCHGIKEDRSNGFIKDRGERRLESLTIIPAMSIWTRDKMQRKINGCWLLMKHKNGAITEEEAVKEVKRMSENSRREVLRTLLLQTEKSVIPWVIRDAFFKLLQIGHYLYNSGTDEFRRPLKNFDDIKAVLYDPISLSTNIRKEMN